MYGIIVSIVGGVYMQKICLHCNQPFETNRKTQVYCPRQHYNTCVICNKQFPIDAGRTVQTCSKECKSELKRRTCIEKYGGPSPTSSPEIQAKIKSTNLEKYGVESLFQSAEYRQKVSDDYYAKTGYRHHWENPEVRAKSEAKWKEHYGEDVKSPLKAKAVREQIKETSLERYGVDNVWKSPEIREKISNTNLERYGYENPLSNPEVQDKVRKTNEERYGKAYYAQTDASRLTVLREPEKLPYLNEFQENPITFIDKYFPDHKPSLKELENIVGVNTWSINASLTKFNCFDKIEYVYSYMEREVTEFLKEIDPDIEIITNSHKIITPYEIDIYLPAYNIGIECNPTSTHNSSINFFAHLDKGEPRKPTSINYHKMKTDLCEEKGVFLFHIFGPEWTHRSEVIKSMLRNLLGKNENKIFARNTYIKEVSAPDMAVFLNANHRQGNAQAPVRLGLYDKKTDELVSLMTFGKMRGTIGTSVYEDTSDVWELVRFCNKVNTSVVGGASKLFQHFTKIYKPHEIRSFSDRAHTRGNLYLTLGFKQVRISEAGYVWVDTKTDIPYHRINAQKSHIREFLKDDTIDIENKSERQIMIEHGYVALYDSGSVLWQWIPSSL